MTELIDPLRHRLAQIVAGPAIGGVAFLDEFALLPRQVEGRTMAVALRARDRLQEGVAHVAVEPGELRIGADRLFNLTSGDGTVEARQVGGVGQCTEPLALAR